MCEYKEIETQTDQETDTGICSICQLRLDDKESKGYNVIRRFPCGHQFHFNCLQGGTITCCPNCRSDINVLCRQCGIPISIITEMDDQPYLLCKECFINKLYSKINQYKDILFKRDRNMQSFQYIIGNIINGVSNATITEEEAFYQLRPEIGRFFSFYDEVVKNSYK